MLGKVAARRMSKPGAHVFCQLSPIEPTWAHINKHDHEYTFHNQEEGHEIAGETIPKSYNEIGITMTEVNNWVKDRRPIVYPFDAYGRRVRLRQSKVRLKK